MVRIQLHLTDEQDVRLRALARKRGVTRAELIRRGIDHVLQEEDLGGHDPLLDLVGSAGVAIAPDLSERHDDVLYRQDDPPGVSLRAAERDPELKR